MVNQVPIRVPVNDDAVVVRGGVMGTDTLQRNAQEHFASPLTPDEWALSVSSLPGATHDEIVAEATEIVQRKYRVAIAADLFAVGFVVVEDDPPHALLLLDAEPTDETCELLRTLFIEEFTNPYHEERTRR